MALIIVLCFVALATVLVVAFIASVRLSSVTENSAAAENSASQLAASAVQLVEGTISYATEPRDDTTVAWACQPGMIRTYGTGSSASADPLAYYKLYSSDNMVISGAANCNQFTTANTPTSLYNEVPQYWDKAPALYADLNAPLLVTSTATGTPIAQPIFPIADPRAQDLGVEGFSTSATPSSLDGTILVTGAASATAAADATKFAPDSTARLPMPVRWTYVLRDGTMTAPDGSGTPTSTRNATATWGGNVSNSAVPTPTNPIVGRVAFWTDDENAKINVNTASEGTYWDTPIANAGTATDTFTYPQTGGIGDTSLASIQGAQREYQRYPGHPATTCLSTVFGSALSSLGATGTAALRASLVKALTDTVPRITDDANASTMGGTHAFPTPPVTPPPLVPDLDRLYASLDEYEFNTTRATPNLNVGAGQGIDQNLVDSCRFMLTAHSKAPELNLYGLPRVAVWPLWDKKNLPVGKSLTAFDQEILRCSTIAAGVNGTKSDPHQMAFFRYDPNSPTNDFQLARNQQVYGYLNTLMSRPVPGFGGNFAQKYGSVDQPQILTEIFDYVRSTNLADQSDNTLSHTYTPSVLPGDTATVNQVATGQVVPTQGPSGSQGFGRIATLAELALILVKVDDRIDPSKLETTNISNGPPVVPNQATSLVLPNQGITIDPSKQTVLEWTLMPKLFSPMAGYTGLGNNIKFRFEVKNLQIRGAGDSGSINQTPGTLSDWFDIGRISLGGRDSVIGGLIGVQSLTMDTYPYDRTWKKAPDASMYPTGICVVTGNSRAGGTLTISGTVIVKAYAPGSVNPANSTPIQTFTFSFPSMTTPIPRVNCFTSTTTNPDKSVTITGYPFIGTFRNCRVPTTVTGGVASFTYNTDNTTKNGNRIVYHMYSTLTNSGGNGLAQGDVVRSLVPTGTINGSAVLNGDMRLVAASTTVPTTAFGLATKSGGVAAGSGDYEVDCLRAGPYYGLAGSSEGTLFSLATLTPPTLTYGYSPEVPAGITAVQMTAPNASVPGDWDNGPGMMVDGPYVNKPDEGMTPSNGNVLPYVGDYTIASYSSASSSTLFSPNRQISSPVMFGSLSVGLDQPWRTLLFRPANLLSTTALHPGGTNPTIRDHLLLDLFWMPVVEPYGISEPFATSGKINLNTQIAPFTYITRTTGLRAVLKSVMLTALNPSSKASNANGFIRNYKTQYPGSGQNSNIINAKDLTRYPLDLDQTIGEFTTSVTSTTPPADAVNSFPEFARASHSAALPNFFVSASQICDVPLIPKGTQTSTLQSFWKSNVMTGDNSLERPYSLIYPRVTTKSNIFTVHVLAQSLKKVTTSDQKTWNEDQDQVLSAYQGAYTIEKYFDPNVDTISTDASGSVASSNDDGNISPKAGIRSTKWRLLSVKRFGQ